MAIPKYQHIKDELKQQIISGKFMEINFILKLNSLKFMMSALSPLSVL